MKRFLEPEMIRTTAAVVLFVACGSATPAAAQRPPRSGEAFQVHPEAQDAIERIKSPYCPGLMLEVCTSAGGAMLRDSIQRMAERGLSGDSIVEHVVREYGEQWRAEPLRSGTGLWAWTVPPAALLLGGGLVGWTLHRRRRAAHSASDVVEPSPLDQERLASALKELEELEEPAL